MAKTISALAKLHFSFFLFQTELTEMNVLLSDIKLDLNLKLNCLLVLLNEDLVCGQSYCVFCFVLTYKRKCNIVLAKFQLFLLQF